MMGDEIEAVPTMAKIFYVKYLASSTWKVTTAGKS
jgi:hypothetical protein